MKTIYMVRHGESETNAGGLILGAEKTALTPRGLLQAEAIAERCERLTIDAIVASPALRTKQTAEVIAKRIGKSIEYEKDFLEWDRGSHRIGKRWDDPELVAGELRIIEHASDPDWREADEETFTDLNARAGRALLFLESRKEENLLLVGHGLFSRILLGRAAFGEDFKGRDFAHLLRFFRTENTGLTVLQFDTPHRRGEWALLTWNDHAHLG
jgi:broad specificity phosphatase PhoE